MKNLIRLSILTVIATFIACCSNENDCKNCKIVTYENNVFVSEDNTVKYCGDELKEKEDATPTTIGNTTTKWECD